VKVVFTDEDFEPILKEHGIDLESMSEGEKDLFIDMFFSGLTWATAANEAAWYISYNRKESINV